MKVINICIPDDLEEIDIENENIDVFVETDDGYTYTLSLATVKNLQFLMDKEKMDYYGPGYPFILVNKLTREIIEQTVNAFAEDGGYWLKVYHFGGWHGAIHESIFDQLKAEHIAERKKLNKLHQLELMRETKRTLKDPVNKTDLLDLVEQYQSGNKYPGIKTKTVPGTCLSELRASRGVRIYFQEKNESMEVVAISDKDNQEQVTGTLIFVYPQKNNI